MCFTILSCSILILGSWICLLKWLGGAGGSVFPLCVCVKLNMGHCRYGSVVLLCTAAILSTWSKPCLSSPQHAAHSCLDVALKVCRCAREGGTRASLKIAPDNDSKQTSFCGFSICSWVQKFDPRSLQTTPKWSVSFKAWDLTSWTFANWSKCKCVWMCKLTRGHEVDLHVQPYEGEASVSWQAFLLLYLRENWISVFNFSRTLVLAGQKLILKQTNGYKTNSWYNLWQ